MIFKSLGRKDKSFNQLYDYMKKGTDFEDLDLTFSHNIFSKERDDILREFDSNAQFLKARKNGNYFYHDILSISRNEHSIDKAYQKSALLDLANTYIKNRAGDCLVYGFIHDEKDNNLHIHLMISANEYQKTNRFRLEKKDFQKAKEITERKCLTDYKELKQDKLINKDKTYKNDKEKLVEDFEYNCSYASSKGELIELMAFDGYEYYLRGNTDGFLILETKKKHRLKTLGIKDQFLNLPDLALKKPHVFKEWVMGDFSERDDNIRKQKSDGVKQKIKDVKDRKEQTLSENIKETGKEWLTGDFKSRDYRAQKPEHFKQKMNDTKKRSEQTVAENIKETANEWLMGDFTNRKYRAYKTQSVKQKIKDTKQRNEQTTTENIKETGKEWLMGDFTNRENRAKNTRVEKEPKEDTIIGQFVFGEFAEANKKTEDKLDKWKEKNNIPLSKKKASLSSINDRKEELQKLRAKASKSHSKEKGKGIER